MAGVDRRMPARSIRARNREWPPGDLAGRNPVTEAEWPHLVRFGTALCDLRRSAGLSQAALAGRVGMAANSISRLERGRRRPRLSTLNVLCAAMVAEKPDLGSSEDLAADLAALAGPALAAESPWVGKPERRRERRIRRLQNRERWAARAVEQERQLPKPEGRAMVRAARAGDFDAVNRLIDAMEADL